MCSLLHELPMREFKCIQSMLTEISSERLRNFQCRFVEYLVMEIETFDYILNLTTGKMQKKRKNCHGNPTTPEERLVLTLRFVEVVLFQRAVIYFFHNGYAYVYLHLYLRTFIRKC
jgi:hypothetical protein